jgi:hypothetical protein
VVTGVSDDAALGSVVSDILPSNFVRRCLINSGAKNALHRTTTRRRLLANGVNGLGLAIIRELTAVKWS